jgi:GAF domain-containing protein
MRYIHKYVDRFADRVFFRKRHEDEAALRNFAHESAYITDRSILLDRALATVKQHTGNADASILVFDGTRSYTTYDKSNGEPGIVGENDSAIVALRAWQKPVDLEKLGDSVVSGQFAFPMVSRGTLVGVLVCGNKQDSEAYAPDEADALLTLAHGVGSALDGLSAERAVSNDSIAIELASLRAAIDRDRDLLLRELRERRS